MGTRTKNQRTRTRTSNPELRTPNPCALVPQPLLPDRARRRRPAGGDARRAGDAVHLGGIAIGTQPARPVADPIRADHRARPGEPARSRSAGRPRAVRARTVRAVQPSLLRPAGGWTRDPERQREDSRT